MPNGFRPAGANLPRPRNTVLAAAAAEPRMTLGDSIVVPQARDRLYEVFQRFQMPDEVKGTLEGSISGDLRLQIELFNAMIDTWPRLAKALAEVKRAIRKAPWKVTPYSRRGEAPTPRAEKIAKDVENAIWSMKPDPKTGLKGFEGTVEELALAYFMGHGVREIHWKAGPSGTFPEGTLNCPPRFFGYPFHADGQDRLMLDPEGGKAGAFNLVDFPPNKFLIGVNGVHQGHPTTAAPLRVLTGYWLAAIFGLKWYMEFTQRFGQPTRWATYAEGDTKSKAQILAMLEMIGSSAYGVFPDGTELNFKDATKSGTSIPQHELLRMADEQCDITILGQTLTTSQGAKGSQSLGNVHMEVRQEVIEGVCDFVGEIATHQFAGAIVAVNYGNIEEVPGVWAVFEKPKDEKGMATRDNELGITSGKIPVSKTWFYERHGIPVPAEGEEIFMPGPGTSEPTATPPALQVKPDAPKSPVQAADVSWRRFPATSGSLGIPRLEMPQIKSGDRAAMVQFFRKRGIQSSEETVQADTLKPTQAEYSMDKVESAMNYKGGNRAILVSLDDHVIDGHHQWKAAEMGNSEIRIIRLMAPIARCLMMAHRMPSTTVAASIREDRDDGRKGKAKPDTTEEKLLDAVLEGLTAVKAEWLAPVRPIFEKLLSLAADGSVTDEDFKEALERSQAELPELFEVLDTEALQEAFEEAIGSAMLAGSVQRYEK